MVVYLGVVFGILLFIELQLISFDQLAWKNTVEPASFFSGWNYEDISGEILFEQREILGHEIFMEMKIRRDLVTHLIIPIGICLLVTLIGLIFEKSTQDHNEDHFTDIYKSHKDQVDILNKEIIPDKKGTGDDLGQV